LRLELSFHNERVVVGRKKHPLRAATSLKKMIGCEWMHTGLRQRESQEYEELFSNYGLPAPRTWMRVESTLGPLSMLSATDALVLLPRQRTDTPMFKAVLEEIKVAETLMAPDIVLVARASVPLTPLAERLAVLRQRFGDVAFGASASG
jgi:hypothetical protein